jgi:hypothetical protein
MLVHGPRANGLFWSRTGLDWVGRRPGKRVGSHDPLASSRIGWLSGLWTTARPLLGAFGHHHHNNRQKIVHSRRASEREGEQDYLKILSLREEMVESSVYTTSSLIAGPTRPDWARPRGETSTMRTDITDKQSGAYIGK